MLDCNLSIAPYTSIISHTPMLYIAKVVNNEPGVTSMDVDDDNNSTSSQHGLTTNTVVSPSTKRSLMQKIDLEIMSPLFGGPKNSKVSAQQHLGIDSMSMGMDVGMGMGMGDRKHYMLHYWEFVYLPPSLFICIYWTLHRKTRQKTMQTCTSVWKTFCSRPRSPRRTRSSCRTTPRDSRADYSDGDGVV
ncbi:hypothetical protein EON65_30540 [archaeon]|nr:MAG: hypothetical protein EON65_30540 [archaeon]